MALGIGSGRYAPAPTRRESDVDHLIATLFQDAREGVLVVDAERRVVASNRAAAALLGIEEGRLTARARCASILHCSKNGECPLVMDAGTSRRLRAEDMPFECVVGDRKGNRVILASCHRLPASSGVARGMILIRDITAQKAAETALIEMVNRDPLTGLYNRRYLDAGLRRVIETAQPVSVLMIDVDLFKLYNDAYGHQQGDRALAAIARLLVGKTRQRDVVARYGGEEFAVVLPATSSERACRVAEKLRRAVAAAGGVNVDQRAGRENPVALPTISIGVATSVVGDTTEDLIDRADGALYTAKHEGRNCVRAVVQPHPALL